MPREKQFETAAEKQAAYRERQRQAAAGVDAEPEFVEPMILPGRPAPPIEEYVAQQLELTRVDIERRSRNRQQGDGHLVVDAEDRLRRTEEYARWRHAGYLAGEIVSL